MFKEACLFIILTMNFLYCQTFLSTSEFGETSELFPKSSCLKIDNVKTTGRCFMGCLNTLEVHYLFSYNEEQAVCLCCFDLSGYDVTSLQWKTFIPRPCKDGYVAYNYTDHQLCLKFVGDKVPYPEAAARCQAEGGDLFKMDTVAKYTIMTDYLAQFDNGESLDVWIQGERIGEEWVFHDASPMPMDSADICPCILGSDPNETRIRASTSIGSSKFYCRDKIESTPFFYLCEYSRSFSFKK